MAIFIACAFGALIGGLFARSVSSEFWWTGMPIGGLVGYLAIDFGAVVRAIPRAWRAAYGGFHLRSAVSVTVRAVLTGVFGIINIFLPVVATTVVMWNIPVLHDWLQPHSFIREMALMVSVLGGLGFTVLSFGECSRGVLTFREIFVKINPFVVHAFGIAFVIYGLAMFTKYLFVEIHSKRRLLCMMDAALGVGLGYLVDYGLAGLVIGTIAGGLFGLLNFEVVSKRWLGIVPNGSY